MRRIGHLLKASPTQHVTNTVHASLKGLKTSANSQTLHDMPPSGLVIIDFMIFPLALAESGRSPECNPLVNVL